MSPPQTFLCALNSISCVCAYMVHPSFQGTILLQNHDVFSYNQQQQVYINQYPRQSVFILTTCFHNFRYDNGTSHWQRNLPFGYYYYYSVISCFILKYYPHVSCSCAPHSMRLAFHTSLFIPDSPCYSWFVRLPLDWKNQPSDLAFCFWFLLCSVCLCVLHLDPKQSSMSAKTDSRAGLGQRTTYIRSWGGIREFHYTCSGPQRRQPLSLQSGLQQKLNTREDLMQSTIIVLIDARKSVTW